MFRSACDAGVQLEMVTLVEYSAYAPFCWITCSATVTAGPSSDMGSTVTSSLLACAARDTNPFGVWYTNEYA